MARPRDQTIVACDGFRLRIHRKPRLCAGRRTAGLVRHPRLRLRALAPHADFSYTARIPRAFLRGRIGDGRARSSAGEHYLDMVGVTGSIPVAPTIPSQTFHHLHDLGLPRRAFVGTFACGWRCVFAATPRAAPNNRGRRPWSFRKRTSSDGTAVFPLPEDQCRYPARRGYRCTVVATDARFEDRRALPVRRNALFTGGRAFPAFSGSFAAPSCCKRHIRHQRIALPAGRLMSQS